jgi:hypothetical protein
MVADALSRKKYCNVTFARKMQPELWREIKYLNLSMVNESKVTMEVEPTLEQKSENANLKMQNWRRYDSWFRIIRPAISQKIVKVPYG